MADTDAQLADALTASAVAERTKVEAVLNRVAAIVTAEQLERLKLTEKVDALYTEVQHLSGLLAAALARLEPPHE